MITIAKYDCNHYAMVTLPDNATDLQASIIEAELSRENCEDCNAKIAEEIFAKVEEIWNSNTK